jgi:hypothetical protein
MPDWLTYRVVAFRPISTLYRIRLPFAVGRHTVGLFDLERFNRQSTLGYRTLSVGRTFEAGLGYQLASTVSLERSQ